MNKYKQTFFLKKKKKLYEESLAVYSRFRTASTCLSLQCLQHTQKNTSNNNGDTSIKILHPTQTIARVYLGDALVSN